MIRRSAIVAIAVTLQQLAAGKTRGWTADQQLVIEALRRSRSSLADATPAQLGDYLRQQSPDAARGTLSNVKGIFHELLVMRAENLDADGITATIFAATNHPGADLEFVMDGQVVRQVQLKAVQDTDAILEALAKYPDTDILATSEAWRAMQGLHADRVFDSGFSNRDITQATRDTFSDLTDDGLAGIIGGGAMTSALVCGALQARAALNGRGLDRAALRSSLELVGIGAGTAVTINALLTLI
ncbi:hypothetical protein [uncultured Paracoccus sp.]|uniref:hypothetical protein n=1 Tax=uncultured Paracoccus sp. TaxID=189685 RepID=UPI0025DDD647|nr:hypothetical protein [uncultured Paracoccus sp.]